MHFFLNDIHMNGTPILEAQEICKVIKAEEKDDAELLFAKSLQNRAQWSR